MASPLRVSAGISPDFAGSCDRGRTLAVRSAVRTLRHRERTDRWVRRGADRGPTARRLAPSAIARRRQHRRRQGQELGGVRRDGAGIARGWQVAVVQFVKSGNWHVGEEKIGRQLGVDWFAVGDGFTWDSDDLEHDRALARDGWASPPGCSHPATTSS